jgi:hypothetical protein
MAEFQVWWDDSLQWQGHAPNIMVASEMAVQSFLRAEPDLDLKNGYLNARNLNVVDKYEGDTMRVYMRQAIVFDRMEVVDKSGKVIVSSQ